MQTFMEFFLGGLMMKSVVCDVVVAGAGLADRSASSLLRRRGRWMTTNVQGARIGAV
jgi:hypothetical protein